MELYVVRHGQTDFNAQGLACGGQSNVPLNDKGRQQARELGVLLSDVHLDAVLVSPLQRAQQTAAIALEGRNVPVMTEVALREHCFGIYEGAVLDHPQFSKLRWDFCYRLPEGESLADVVCRVYPFLADLPKRFGGKSVLLVCHGALARVIDSFYTSPTNEQFRGFSLANCQLLHYSVSE